MFYNFKDTLCGKKHISGRSNTGKTTVWHRGGGHKTSYKFVDYFRKPSNFFFKVAGFEYNSARSSFVVTLVSHYKKQKIYSRIIQPKGLLLFSLVINHEENISSFNVGNSYFIKDLPVGSFVHNVEKVPGFGGKYARAAGTYGQVVQKSETDVLIKLPSGKLVLCQAQVRCTFGMVGNENHKLVVVGKAGRSRWIGRRPIVRGVAINPIDHPHGGGEGKSQVGRHPVSPWGKLTKGKKVKLNYYEKNYKTESKGFV